MSQIHLWDGRSGHSPLHPCRDRPYLLFNPAASGFFLLCLVGILLAAFWLRTENLSLYPPGVSNDEGVDVIDVFHIARTGIFPMYEDLGRPEPLYLIIQAVVTKFIGPGVWTARLTTAFIGVLNIAAVYWCTAQCLRDVPPAPRRVAALAAAVVLTVTIGHVTLSRAIYRAILQPLCMFLFTGFLMRGLHTERWRDFVLCGILLAVTLYTYTAAYVVPFALLPVGVNLLIFRRRGVRLWLPRLVAAGMMGGILMLPVVIRLLDVPEAVIGRASAVSGANNWLDIGQLPHILPALFFGAGDQNPQYNVALMPLIPEVFQPFFVLGLVALVIRLRQPSSWLLAALLLLCTVPVLLTEEIPHGLRIAGEFGVFPVVTGMAAAVILVVVNRYVRASYIAAGTAGLLAGVLCWQAGSIRAIYVDYWINAQNHRLWRIFDRQLTHNEWFFRTDRRSFAEWLSTQNYPMLLPLEEILNITTRAWLLRDYPEIETDGENFRLPANTHLIIPWALSRNDIMRDTRDYVLLDNHTIILLPPLSEALHSELMTDIESGEKITGGGGQLDFMGYVKLLIDNMILRFEGRMSGVKEVSFGNEISVSGIRGENRLTGEAGPVSYTVVWSKSDRVTGHDYWSYVQLLTQDYQFVAGSMDAPILRWLYPTTQWSMLDAVPVRYTMDVPDLLPGAYRLVAGVYPPFGEELPAYDISGHLDTTSPTIAWIKVPQRDAPVPGEKAVVMNALVESAFQLTAIEAERLNDEQIQINLYWRGLINRPEMDATVFVHVVDDAGKIVAQSDIRPWNGQYPTFIWDAGERVRTEHIMNLSGGTKGLRLRAGMYVFPGPQNLSVIQNGVEKPDGLIEVSTSFELP